MNRGMWRASKPVLPNRVSATVRVQPQDGNLGLDCRGPVRITSNPYRDPSQPLPGTATGPAFLPHLRLGPATQVGWTNTADVALYPNFLGKNNVQFMLGDSSAVGDDTKFGFYYIVFGSNPPIIGSVSMGPNQAQGNVIFGGPSIGNSGITFIGVGHGPSGSQSVVGAQLHVQRGSNASNITANDIFYLDAIFGGTPTAGFGGDLRMLAQSSTTVGRNAALIQWTTVVATDATRTYRLTGSASDSAGDREGWRVEANGTVALLSFFGGTAVVQQANASQAAITAVTDANAKSALQAIYNLLHQYNLAPATA